MFNFWTTCCISTYYLLYLTPPPRLNPSNIRICLIFLDRKLESLAYIVPLIVWVYFHSFFLVDFVKLLFLQE